MSRSQIFFRWLLGLPLVVVASATLAAYASPLRFTELFSWLCIMGLTLVKISMSAKSHSEERTRRKMYLGPDSEHPANETRAVILAASAVSFLAAALGFAGFCLLLLPVLFLRYRRRGRIHAYADLGINPLSRACRRAWAICDVPAWLALPLIFAILGHMILADRLPGWIATTIPSLGWLWVLSLIFVFTSRRHRVRRA